MPSFLQEFLDLTLVVAYLLLCAAHITSPRPSRLTGSIVL